MAITRETLLKPEGQKFGIGDSVRITWSETGFYPGCYEERGDDDVWLVKGSYFQQYGPINGDKLRAMKDYSVVCPETGRTCAWVVESSMQLVDDDAIQALRARGEG